MTDHDIPEERDLPAGRLAQLKDDLMTQIQHDGPTGSGEPRRTGATHRRRWRRLGLAAAALAAGFGLAATLVAGGDDSASANTAIRADDGTIVITIRERRDPEALQRRLNDLGVPAVVDFLESGFGCDLSRSTGWVEPRGEGLLTHAPEGSPRESDLILDPDHLRPGETVVIEFQIDEHEGALATNTKTRLSTGPVGECVPVPDGSIVDAERGIAGG